MYNGDDIYFDYFNDTKACACMLKLQRTVAEIINFHVTYGDRKTSFELRPNIAHTANNDLIS
jgi:hypothetical protein